VKAAFASSPEFQRLLAGDRTVDLTRIALEIARDAYPELEAGRYLAQLDALAVRVKQRCAPASHARQILGHINWVLFVEEKFHGNTESYYDARNSYLNEVLERKTGIPISLCVVYKAIADRLGLAMAGVNLPAHFVLRTGQGSKTLFVDPFHAGALLDRRGCEKRVADLTGQSAGLTDALLAPCSLSQVVARMLRNLKAIYLRENDYMAALPVLRRLVAVSEGDPQERRDLGMVCMHTERAPEAVEHLQAYLDAFPATDDSEAVNYLLRAARHERAQRN
jgi:regulator of sirC expression with transglutaminase-like and TPR domain